MCVASSFGQGVVFPANRFEPEEAGYYESYMQAGGKVTGLIDIIQFNKHKADYLISIADPGQAELYRAKYIRGIAELRANTVDKQQWLCETLPPPAFKTFHQSLRSLAGALQSSADYNALDPRFRETYREMNNVKLVMDKRPYQSDEDHASNIRANLLVRPLNLPIVYNVTTGQWFISATYVTPLGSVTLAAVPNVAAGSGATGPFLLKIVIGNSARYVITKPGTRVSFQKEQLRILDHVTEQHMNVLTLEPINRPTELSLETESSSYSGIGVTRVNADKQSSRAKRSP